VVLQAVLLFNVTIEKPIKESLQSILLGVKSVYSYFIIIGLFILGLLLSPFTVQTAGDIINLLISISFIILFIVKLNTIEKLYLFRDYFLKLFITLFSLYLLTRFSVLIYEGEFSKFFFVFNNNEDFDRNSYTLNLWITIISIIYLIRKVNVKKGVFLLNFYISLLLSLVLFSSSRRGILILVIFSSGFVIWQLYILFRQKHFVTKFTPLFLIYLGIILIVSSIIIMPAYARNIVYENTIKDVKTKSIITQTLRRYYILVFPNTTYKEFKAILWSEYYYSDINSIGNLKIQYSPSITVRINHIQKQWEKVENKGNLLNLLPELSEKQRLFIDDNNISFLPEISKLSYTYSKFFSFFNINNLELVEYNKENKSFPFRFVPENDNPFIVFKLPALSNSYYKLQFKIKNNVNQINQLRVNGMDEILYFTYSSIDSVFSYSFKYKAVLDSDISDLQIYFNNEKDSFYMSDISWSLLETINDEKESVIYSKLKKELKRFKHEQNRTSWIWTYYANAEKQTSTNGYCKRVSSPIIDSINKAYLGARPNIYYGANIILGNIDSVIFSKKYIYPRMSFRLPVLQKCNLNIKLDYYLSDTMQNIDITQMSEPQITNVVLNSSILYDSIISIDNHNYKRSIMLSIDSVNSAKFILKLGLKNIKQDQLLVFKNYSFKLYTDKDSIYASDAQLNYINNLSKRVKIHKLQKIKRDSIQTKVDSFNLLVQEEQVNPYWNIDTNIYQYASADRLELWLFGWQYFKSLPWYKQIFGDGFNYYKVYSLRFGSKYDYSKVYFPHNPLISALLYSGIIGVLAYIFFLFQVFYYYFKYRKEMGIFVVLFLLIFTYSFISGRSHFTIPYYIIFTMFPFIIRNIMLLDRKPINKTA